MQEQKEEQDFFSLSASFQRPHECAVCRGFVCTESIVTLLHVMCTNNDGMEKLNRDWGVVFKVAEKMRDAGVRPPAHLTLLTLLTALSNLGWGCVFTRH